MNDVRSGHAQAVPVASGARQGASASSGAGDGEIRSAIDRGDHAQALSLCVRQHGASVGRLCFSLLGSATDADDLLQETLVAAHQGFSEFAGRGSVRSWLCGIARHKCLKLLEKKRRRSARLRLVGEPEAAAGVEEVVGARRRVRQLAELLERVRPSDRDLLLLRYGAELSFAEAAQICGVSEAAARKRASRALCRLRGALELELALPGAAEGGPDSGRGGERPEG